MKDRIINLMKVLTLVLVPMLVIALTMQGCGTKCHTAQAQYHSESMTDSVASYVAVAGCETGAIAQSTAAMQAEGLRIQSWEPVAAEVATVNVPLADLAELPDGAGYGNSSGRASVALKRVGDNIEITGHCDSLAQRCEVLEYNVWRYQEEVDSLNNRTLLLEAMLEQSLIESNESGREKSENKPGNARVWVAAMLASAGGVAAGVYITKSKRV